jgi:hypothetical protein
MSTPSLGKNVVIREIMRQREAKKVPNRINHSQPFRDSSNLLREVIEIDNHDVTKRVGAKNIENIRSVTFENTVQADHTNDNEANALHSYSMHSDQLGSVDTEENENSEDSSLSSSHWALMQYDLGPNNNEPNSTPWNKEEAENLLLHLLDSSLVSASSPSKPETRVISRDILLSNDIEPNVSWSDDSNEFDNTDDQAGHASPKRRDDEKAAPSSSPFSTFRHNSTNIALDETQVYLHRIRSLEQQLEETQRRLSTERENRNAQQHPIVEEDAAPAMKHRTPASARSHKLTNRRLSTTPQTPASTLATSHSESLWERNKTLVTEIRFADQTCVELAYQKSLLEEQVETLQKKNSELECTIHRLETEIETSRLTSATIESELGCRQQLQVKEKENRDKLRHDATTDQSSGADVLSNLLEEKKALMQELHDARHQISSLHDELIENFESSQQEIFSLKDQIQDFVSESKSNREELESKQESLELMNGIKDENDKLHQKLVEYEILLGDTLEKAKERVTCVANTMNDRYEKLQSILISKIDTFDARIRSVTNIVRYMEDAILMSDVDEEEDDTDSASLASSTRTEKVHHHVEEYETIKAEVDISATLSGRNQNQTIDLALMEEARTILPKNWGNGESTCTSDENVTTPNKLRYHFNGVSRVLSDDEFPYLFSEGGKSTTASVNGCSDSHFYDHLQWSGSPNPMHNNVVQEHPYGTASCKPFKSSNDIRESTTVSGISKFHLGFKQIHSNLSYSESDNSSIHPNDAREDIQGSHEKEYPKPLCKRFELDQYQPLRNERFDKSEMLDKSLDQISKIHNIASAEELRQSCEENFPQTHKLVVDEQLKMIGNTRDTTKLSLKKASEDSDGEGTSDTDDLRASLDTLQAEKCDLLNMLTTKTNEIKNAHEHINTLNDEAIKREKLILRYATLRHELEEADLTLKEKSIVPRQRSGEKDLHLAKLHEQISIFREELQISIQKIEHLTAKLEDLEETKNKKIAALEVSLTNAIEERNTFHQELLSLHVTIDTLTHEKQSLEAITGNQSREIEKSKEMVRILEGRTEAAENESLCVQVEFQKSEANIRAIKDDLEKVTHDRDDLIEKIATKTKQIDSLNEENHCIKSKLDDKEFSIRTEQRNKIADSQINDFRVKLNNTLMELEKVQKANAAFTQLLSQAEMIQKEKQHEADVHATELIKCNENIVTLERELHDSNMKLTCSTDEITKLRCANDELRIKFMKLRGYTRKVFKKCRDWEIFHERESNVVQHLQFAYHRSRQKASELSTICQEKDHVCHI